MFFLFWGSISKIVYQKQTFTHFSADFLLPVTSLMLRRLMFVIPSLLFNDIIMTQVPYLTWILDLHFNITEGSFKDTFTFVFFCFEALFPRFGQRSRLVRIFQLISFTGPLINVEGEYVWNPKSVGSRAKKLWAVTFLPLEAAGGLNQPPRSFSYMFLSKGCLELSELVWHLVFCCKLLSPEPSKTTLKNWTQPRWKLWPPGMGPLRGF